MNQIEHHVRIGQIKTADAGEVLKTVLGSCVGIALIWKRHKKYALAHCLLPEPVGQGVNTEARYVTQAIPRMLEKLGVSECDFCELEAVIAGGGQMMDDEKSCIKFVVGLENLKIAKSILEKMKIKIIAYEPGGEQGTKMRVDTSTGEFIVERIPRAA